MDHEAERWVEATFRELITRMALHDIARPRHTTGMRDTRPKSGSTISNGRPLRGATRLGATRLGAIPPGARQLGSTLLDACAALALSSLAAFAVVSGMRPLSCAVRVAAARTVLTGALIEARREAYATETTVSVQARSGEAEVIVTPPGSARVLGDGVSLTSAPTDGNVQFRGSGLADNATLSIACDASTASVVVNQRGVIR